MIIVHCVIRADSGSTWIHSGLHLDMLTHRPKRTQILGWVPKTYQELQFFLWLFSRPSAFFSCLCTFMSSRAASRCQLWINFNSLPQFKWPSFSAARNRKAIERKLRRNNITSISGFRWHFSDCGGSYSCFDMSLTLLCSISAPGVS